MINSKSAKLRIFHSVQDIRYHGFLHRKSLVDIIRTLQSPTNITKPCLSIFSDNMPFPHHSPLPPPCHAPSSFISPYFYFLKSSKCWQVIICIQSVLFTTILPKLPRTFRMFFSISFKLSQLLLFWRNNFQRWCIIVPICSMYTQ